MIGNISAATDCSACAIARFMLLGFAAAPRRSELAALAVEDLRFEAEDVTLRLRCSKTNQEGEEEVMPIPYGSDAVTCPHNW